MAFTVTNIVDGNTIEVAGWKWASFSGTKVKIVGYSFNGKSENYNLFAKNRLTTLLLNKQVELQRVVKADKGNGEKEDILHCSVILNGVDVSQYFPELRAHA